MTSPIRSIHFAALAVLAVCTALATGCGGSRSEQYRMEGDTYMKLGKIDEAASSYVKAIAANPENAQARIGLGRCLEDRGDLSGALEEFEAAIALDPTLHQAYFAATGLLLHADSPDEAAAMDLAGRLEQHDPERGGSLRAFIHQSMGRQDEALSVLEGLRENFPESVDLRMSLAVAYMEANQPARAETELRTLLSEISPDNTAARAYLLRACQMQGKAEEMVTEFEELLKVNPDAKELKEGLARSLLSVGRTAEAESVAMEFLGIEPNAVWANYVKGAVLLGRNEVDAAVTYLKTAAQQVPEGRSDLRDEIAEQLSIARSLGAEVPEQATGSTRTLSTYASGSWQDLWEQAELETLIARSDEFLAAEEPLMRETLLLSAVFVGDLATAQRLAVQLPAESPYKAYIDMLGSRNFDKLIELFTDWQEDDQYSDRALLRENALGFALGRAGLRGRAVRALQATSVHWPDNVVSLYNMASIFQASDQPRFAARILQKLRERYSSNLRAQLLHYQTLREGNMLREARNVAAITYVQFPHAPEAILNFAESLMDGQEPNLALKLIERAKDGVPGNAAVLAAFAKVHLHLGDTAAAAAVLESMESEDASQLVPVAAVIAAMQGDWDRCAASIEGVSSEAGRNLGLRLLRAAAKAKGGDAQEARASLASIETDASFWQTHSGAVLRIAFGLDNAQPNALGEALRLAPGAAADFLLGLSLEALAQQNGAFDAYLAAEAAVPNQAMLAETALLNLVRSCTRRTSLPAARALAERYPDQAGVWLSYAVLLHLEEDPTAELEAFERAVEADPQNPRVWLRRGQFYEAQGDLTAALADFQRVVALAPEDAAGNNNVAYLLLLLNGDLNEAIRRASLAKERLPHNADVLHTLGLAQLEAQLYEESALSLRLAMELRPGDPTMMLDYGRLRIAQGEQEEGLGHIRDALSFSENLGLKFSRRDEAAALVARATAG